MPDLANARLAGLLLHRLGIRFQQESLAPELVHLLREGANVIAVIAGPRLVDGGARRRLAGEPDRTAQGPAPARRATPGADKRARAADASSTCRAWEGAGWS